MRRPLAIRRRRRLERPRSPRRCSPAATPRWLTPATPARPHSTAADFARSSRITRSGNVATDADLLAPVLARHLDGRPRRPAGIGLRDPRVGGRYLLCSGGLGLAADDRPHFY